MRWPDPWAPTVREIYTDVDGIFSADPRIVPNARHLDTVTFEEMLELAACGAKEVLMLRCVEYARRYNIPVHVRSANSDKPGTVVTGSILYIAMEDPILTGVAHDRSEAKVTVVGIPDYPGYVAKIFRVNADGRRQHRHGPPRTFSIEIAGPTSHSPAPATAVGSRWRSWNSLKDEIGFSQ